MAARKKTPTVGITDQILNPEDKGPIKEGIDDLIGALGSDEIPDKFPIVVNVPPNFYTLMFRYPHSTEDLVDHRNGGFDMLSTMRDWVTKRNCPAPMLKALDAGKGEMGDLDIVNAWTIHYWSHKSEKISLVQAVTMVRRNPAMAHDLVSRIDKAIKNGISIIRFEGVLDAKKDSTPTSGNNSDSKPPAGSSTSTPTG